MGKSAECDHAREARVEKIFESKKLFDSRFALMIALRAHVSLFVLFPANPPVLQATLLLLSGCLTVYQHPFTQLGGEGHTMTSDKARGNLLCRRSYDSTPLPWGGVRA